jgi:C4-dicarboxylate transporter DctQ subunit
MIREKLENLEENFIALMLVSMTLMVFVEVIGRFVFYPGIIWMEELTLYVSAWMVLFGASWGGKLRCHIGVDAVVKLLSARGQKIAGIIAMIASLIYCGLIGYGGWVYLSKIKSIGLEMDDLVFQRWIAESILVFGMALLAFRLFEILWLIIQNKSVGFHPIDESQEVLNEMHLNEKKT